jgi:NAD kinase
MRIKYVVSEDFRSEEFNKLINLKFPQFLNEKEPELILVSGGDGALLHAIQNYNHYQVPFIGRAAGTLNFLMNTFNKNKEEKLLNELLKNKQNLHIIDTNSIKVQVLDKAGKNHFLGQGVNEVVLGSNIMSYHHFSVTSQDHAFEDFDLKGSGICVSTDLGSTGYNFNLGAPVLPLASDLWVVSGVVCNRYLNDILNTQKLQIKIISNRVPCYTFLDGIKKEFELKAEDKVILEEGNKIKIAFLEKDEFITKRVDITSRFRKG